MMTEPVTILFAGGGTGGHLFPGIAVAQELRRRHPGVRTIFVGSTREIESAIVSEFQLEHRSLPVEPLPVLKRNPFRFFVRNAQALLAARRMIRELNPVAVIGLGGFASAPIVWAAHRRSPVILLEQNVIPGRTNRWLSRFADHVCMTFEQSKEYFSSNAVIHFTGNPVREEIAEMAGVEEPRIEEQDRPRLLILGGSQGADSLNDAILVAIEKLQANLSDWGITHQTGPRQVEQVQRFYQSRGLVADVQAFFPDLPTRYRHATLVISRSGATTMSELACVGCPMILVPCPHAADNHQVANANAFRDRGAAITVEHLSSSNATGERLAAALIDLISDRAKRQVMGRAARACAMPDAAGRVADLIDQASSRRRS